MDLLATLRVVLRRWAISVPVLIVFGVVTVALVGATPSQYKTTASLVVLVPANEGGADGGSTTNPYLRIGGSQSVAAAVLQASTLADDFRRALIDQGVHGEWTLGSHGDNPLLDITITEQSSALASTSARLVVAAIKQRFADLQTAAGSPIDQLIQLVDITPPAPPQPQNGNKVKIGLAMVAVGVGAAIGAAFVVEGISRSRGTAAAARVSIAARAPVPTSNGTATNGTSPAPPGEPAPPPAAPTPTPAPAAPTPPEPVAPLPTPTPKPVVQRRRTIRRSTPTAEHVAPRLEPQPASLCDAKMVDDASGGSSPWPRSTTGSF